MPGSPLDPRADGPNQLIVDGACLTRSADDVIQALTSARDRLAAASQTAEEEAAGPDHYPEIGEDDRTAVFAALSPSPIAVDIVAAETGLDARRVTVALMELEIAGRLRRYAGGRVATAS